VSDTPDLSSLLASMPFSLGIGVELDSASAESVQGHLDWSEDRCTVGGALHGGALMALADSLGAICAFLNLPEGAAGTSTIESKTNFFRGVRSGDGPVSAVSTPLHAGRTTVVVQTDLRDAAGRRVALVTQTQAVIAAR
jgi:uncharacterized protein (TIGR00369 family)